MMVLTRHNGFRMFFSIRGSVLPRIARSLLLCTALAVLVTLQHGSVFRWQITLTPVPFSLMGLALAIFLGFRNGTAYERYWEARKLWGDVLHRARTLARQLQTLTQLAEPARWADQDDLRRRMILRAIAFAHALRHQLRGSDARDYITRWVPPLVPSVGDPNAHLAAISADLGQLLRAGQVDARIAAEIDATLTSLSADAAGCDRIKNTPIPFAYTLLLHRTAYLYCFLLPFGLVETVGFMTPVVVAIVAYAFFGLDALGNEIEDPFGTEPNHLPLDALCRAIEIDLLRALEAPALPEALQPVDGWLR
jgi:ion channel-forming bestrophin family protein